MRARDERLAFTGPLARQFEAFVAFRRDLRTCHEHLGVALRHLDRFLVTTAPTAAALGEPLLRAWMGTLADRAAITRRNYFRVARQFCLFCTRTDPTVFVPDRLMGPRVIDRFQPYVLSEEEMRGILTAAARLPGGLRPHTYVTLLLILYTTGIRIGEARRLQLADVDRARAVLHIRAGKFRKARLVPISASLLRHLGEYLLRRHRTGAPMTPDAPVFCSPRGGPYSLIGLQKGLTRILRAACGKPPGRAAGPRVHDVRHSFAVHRLLHWYRDGADVQAKLPLLATYLGHGSFLSTQRYLTATPELLAEASRRFHCGFGALVDLEDAAHDRP
jgi:integrase/recombinase XerD